MAEELQKVGSLVLLAMTLRAARIIFLA